VVSWFGVLVGRLALTRSSSFGIVNLGMLLAPGAVGVRDCGFRLLSRVVDGSLMRLLSLASNSFQDTGVALGEGTATELFEPPWCCFSCVTLATHWLRGLRAVEAAPFFSWSGSLDACFDADRLGSISEAVGGMLSLGRGGSFRNVRSAVRIDSLICGGVDARSNFGGPTFFRGCSLTGRASVGRAMVSCRHEAVRRLDGNTKELLF
jgi:hypothetical protein